MPFRLPAVVLVSFAWLTFAPAPALAGVACPSGSVLCTANTLWAATRPTPSGDVDLLEVDRTTGATAFDRTFNVGAGNVVFNWAYHESLDRFVGLAFDDVQFDAHSIAILDRATRDVQIVPISGVPGSAPSLGTLTYDPIDDRVLASFADDGSSVEDQLVVLGTDGVAGSVSTAIAEDMDVLVHQHHTGAILGWDGNASGGPRLFELTDLFGTLTASAPLPLPNRSDLGAVVPDPGGDTFYVVDRAADGLVRIDAGMTLVDVGPFGHTAPVGPLFVGPATSCGDGIVDPGETCDDGGTTLGDGCDDLCQIEPPPGACPDAIGLAGEVQARVRLQFAKADKDQVQVKGKSLGLPAGFALPGAVVVDLGGVAIEAALDAKGRYKSADKREFVKLKQSKKDGTWKLAAKRKKSDLAADFADEGLVDEDNPKPGKPVLLPLCLTAAGQNHALDLPATYRSRLGKSGKAR